MPQLSIKITPSMYEDSALDILLSLSEGRITITRFFQLLQLTPAGKEEDNWLDLVDIVIDRGVEGFQEIHSALREHNPNASFRQRTSSASDHVAFPALHNQVQTRPLRQDPAAWRMVWDWAVGLFEFPKLVDMLATTFGDNFIEAEWSSTFDAVLEASRPHSDDELSLAALTDNGNTPPSVSAPVQAVEEAMKALGVSISASRMFVPCPQVSTSHPPSPNAQRPPKRRKTAFQSTPKSASIFLDVFAEEGDDDEGEGEGKDEDVNEVVAHSNPVAQICPAGQVHYHQSIQRIAARYEERQPPIAPGFSVPLEPHHLVLPEAQGPRLYIVDFPTRNIATFCCTIFENRGLQCQVIASLPNKVYVEATSPLEIQVKCPPSHTSTIRSILRVPDEDRPSIHMQPSIRPLTWARVLRGSYRDDVAYILSCEHNSCEVLIVPRCRPYDKIDEDDIPEVQQRSLFDETEARNAGCQVLTLDRSAGILRCKGEEYHRGLLRRVFRKTSIETIETPHPDRILLHAEAQVDPVLVKQTYTSFSIKFWKQGDLVRSTNGSLVEQRCSIVSIGHDQGEVTLKPCDPDLSVCTVPTSTVRRVFRQGDTVRILAGLHRGFVGTIINLSEDQATLLLEDKDVVVVSLMFLESHLTSHIWTLTSHHSGLEIDLSHSPKSISPGTMQGDWVTIASGTHNGLKGYVDSIEDDGWIWVMAKALGAENLKHILIHEDEAKICPPENVLAFTKEKGYNVTVGDTLHVVRGLHYGVIGIVRSVDFPNAEVEVISEMDGRSLKVPISFCGKVVDFSESADLCPPIGCDVWTIGGKNNRGLRVTLRAVNRSWCYVSYFGQYSLKLRTRHVATEEGVLLDGTRLRGPRLRQLKALVARSFIPEEPRARTPPPSETTSAETFDDDPSSAWKVTPDDISVDKGSVEWLFDDNFCNFSGYQLCFYASAGYRRGNYMKRVMYTTSDRFSNNEGHAPPGHVALTVTGNHTGAATENHHVPARFLTPASPIARDQVVLVLRGDWRGRFCRVIKWARKEKKATVTPMLVVASSHNDTLVLPASDICLAAPL